MPTAADTIEVDLSRWNGRTSAQFFADLKGTYPKLDAITLKAGGDDGGEYADEQYANSMAVLSTLDYDVADYWFMGLTNRGKDQATEYVTIRGANNKKPGILDWELVGNYPVPESIVREAAETYADKTGMLPWIYSGAFVCPTINAVDGFWAKHQYWGAAYIGYCPLPLPWANILPVAWQFLGSGQVGGLPGISFDESCLDGLTLAQFKACYGPNPPPPLANPNALLTIIQIQKMLNTLGFGPLFVDNLYGPATQKALKAFQTKNGLVADGIPGPLTDAALRKATPVPV